MQSLIVTQILVIKVATVNLVINCPSTVSHDSAECRYAFMVYLRPLVTNNFLYCWTNVKNYIEGINIVTITKFHFNQSRNVRFRNQCQVFVQSEEWSRANLVRSHFYFFSQNYVSFKEVILR